MEGKRRELGRHSNSVLAALQRAGLEEHTVHILWEGVGRAAAVVAEAKLVREHLAMGCVLANIQGGLRLDIESSFKSKRGGPDDRLHKSPGRLTTTPFARLSF